MMTKTSKVRLLEILLAGGVIFLLRRLIRSRTDVSIASSSGFLLSAFLFAMVTMQAGLVRSDAGHIAIATFTMIVFASVILFSFQSRAASVLGVSAAILCSIWFAHPASMFYPSSVRYRYAQLRHPLTACPNDFKEFDRVCFPEELPGLLSAGSDYLQQHSGAADSIVVFPYQTMFGIVSQPKRRRRSDAVLPGERPVFVTPRYCRSGARCGASRSLSSPTSIPLMTPTGSRALLSMECRTSPAVRKYGSGSSAITGLRNRSSPESLA